MTVRRTCHRRELVSRARHTFLIKAKVQKRCDNVALSRHGRRENAVSTGLFMASRGRDKRRRTETKRKLGLEFGSTGDFQAAAGFSFRLAGCGEESGLTGRIPLPAGHCDFNFSRRDGLVERIEVAYRRHVHETVVHPVKKKKRKKKKVALFLFFLRPLWSSPLFTNREGR